MTAPNRASGLIGREPQLAALGEAFERAQGGEPVTVLIAGEAGIGKTRLVDELLTVTAGAGARTVVGQSVEIGDQGPAFAPLVGVMRALLTDLGRERILDLAGASADALGHLLPELGLGVPDGGDGHGRLYEVVTTVLEQLAADESLVVVLEDLQWADAPTRDLLRFLVRATRRGGLLLVLTYRSDELHRGHPLRPFLAELDRLRRVERLEVPRLSVDEVGALVREILGREVTAAATSKIHRRTAGIPFFVEELVNAVDERGGGDLPESLRDLLLVRVEPLAETTQRLLKLMGAGGNRVEHAVLFAAAGLDVDSFEAALREAVSAGVVVVDGDGYAFRHALLREALHDDMLPGEHERFHVRYAEALEANSGLLPPGTAAVEIAHHWDSAHDVERAFATSFAAADALDRSYANGSAAQMFERALELWDRVADPEGVSGMRRDELLVRAALMARLAGEHERALALVKAAVDLVDRDAEPRTMGELLALKGDLLTKTGRPHAVETLHEALALIPAEPPSIQRARILDSLATIAMLETQFDDAVELATEAIALGDEAGNQAVRSSAHNTRGTVWVQEGRFDEGFAELDRAREAADGMPAQLLRYHINASDALNLVGRYAEAAELASQGRDHASEYGRKRTHGSMLAGNAAEPLFLAGDWPRAERLLDRGIELDPPPTHGRHMQILRAWLAVWRGQLDDAADIVDELRDNFRRRVVLPQDIQLMTRIAADLDLARGDSEAAWDAVAAVLRAAGRPGDRPSSELPLAAVGARALATRIRDGSAHPGEVADDVRFVRELVERQAAAWLPTVWPAVVDAEFSVLAGAEIAAWQRAVDQLSEAEGPAHLRVYAGYRLGEAQLTAGDRPAAKATLRQAVTDADELGAGLIRGWVGELAGAAHLALVEAVPGGGSPLAGLTARELEVLHLVAAGKSNREIGEALFISAKTASVHVSNILAKLGVAGRGEAAAIAHREGLLESTAAS